MSSPPMAISGCPFSTRILAERDVRVVHSVSRPSSSAEEQETQLYDMERKNDALDFIRI